MHAKYWAKEEKTNDGWNDRKRHRLIYTETLGSVFTDTHRRIISQNTQGRENQESFCCLTAAHCATKNWTTWTPPPLFQYISSYRNEWCKMKDISRSEAELTLAASFILLINFLAVTGNFMVCLAVYRNRSLLTVPFLYVLALAISDFLVALLCFPFCVSAAIQGRWVFGHLFCQFNGFILYCWAAVSVFVLALTAINRFYRVCKPNTYRRIFTMKNSLFVIVSACVLPVGGGLIATFAGPVTYKYSLGRFFCVASYNDKNMERSIGLTLHVVHVLLPMIVIIFCYCKVFGVVRHHSTAVIPSLQAAHGTNSNVSMTLFEARATKMLFSVLVGFTVCWTPVFVVGVLACAFSSPLPQFADLIYTFFAVSSSVINPFIYGFMNRAFRKEFKKILRCYQ